MVERYLIKPSVRYVKMILITQAGNKLVSYQILNILPPLTGSAMTYRNQSNAKSTSFISGLINKIKAVWYDMPVWKRWMLGASIVLGVLAGIGLLLTSFVFTGGTTALIVGGIAAGLSIGSGITGAIFNGHSTYQFFKQGKIAKGIFALIGCLAGILGCLGSIFQVANAVSAAALIGISAGSAAGTAISSSGGIVAGYLDDDQEMELEEFGEAEKGLTKFSPSLNRSPVTMTQKLGLDTPIKKDSVPTNIEQNPVSYTKLFDKQIDINGSISNETTCLSMSSGG